MDRCRHNGARLPKTWLFLGPHRARHMSLPAAAPTHLRLVRDDDPPRASDVAADIANVSAGETLEQVEALRTEISALTAELSLLRRKGETLNFHLSRLDEELRLAARLQQDF